ncbi:MAG TPA: hypothetical protein VH796_15145 [Nitrososphaeraceae archaeon]
MSIKWTTGKFLYKITRTASMANTQQTIAASSKNVVRDFASSYDFGMLVLLSVTCKWH